jgi:hypothetical protein
MVGVVQLKGWAGWGVGLAKVNRPTGVVARRCGSQASSSERASSEAGPKGFHLFLVILFSFSIYFLAILSKPNYYMHTHVLPKHVCPSGVH